MLLLPHRDVGAAAALETLSGHDLIGERTQPPSLARPRVDVVLEGDGLVRPGRALGCADAPVLIERLVAVDGRRVGSLHPIQVVGAAIGGHGARGARPGWTPAAPT